MATRPLLHLRRRWDRMATCQETISEFDNANEDWTSYTERLQHYFSANEIEADTKQKAILLSCCGPKTNQLVKNLLTPEKPADKSYADIVQLVKAHLDPKPSIIVQRFFPLSVSQGFGLYCYVCGRA